MAEAIAPNQDWNVACYESNHAFVWQLGEALVDLLAPQPGEQIVDLGCGPGQLTAKLAATGARVVGLDADAQMVETARRNYPHLEFDLADARHFQRPEAVDAVFSNAVLHWIPDADAVIRSIHRALKPGGRLVVEFGGKGNIETVVRSLYQAMQPFYPHPETLNPWYFPSVSDYASRLESQGFEVRYATLFDRPTPLEGDAGLANWLTVFAQPFLRVLSDEPRSQVIATVEHLARPRLYREGRWYADYRRIRIMAIKSDGSD